MAALLFPALGPGLDHHFAERQPGHVHFGPTVYHVHVYDIPHRHLHTADHSHGDDESPMTTTSGYDYSGSPVVALIAVETMCLVDCFQPTSIIHLPAPSESQPGSAWLDPPYRPPSSMA